MKCLVIGGAGYIGSHIVLELLDTGGHQVTVFDNLSTGSLKNVPDGVGFIEGDILNDADLVRVFGSDTFDVVFHFAALKAAGEYMDEPGKYAHHNITGSINILNAMVEYDVRKMIFSSSAAVYGYPEYLPIDENHPTKPVNFYGFTKLEIERILKWYSQLKGLRFAALRYFNAAGYDVKRRISEMEKNCANLLPIVMEAADEIREKVLVFGADYDTHDGTGVRDYIHVNDLATAHIKAMIYLDNKNKDLIINLGTGIGYSVLDVINGTNKITGKDIPYNIVDRRPGDPDNLVAKSLYANKLLSWKPKYSDLDTLLKSMWKMYGIG
ncbi:MAG: UDP-glucose 4-epimerase GalE [Candidatus Marinimicrobia bacterium]|nr:UDP-glucose 4-epimerase GalE [Candidatus Neomarinimicrobiota bacterium]